jgi:sugar phosphate permease
LFGVLGLLWLPFWWFGVRDWPEQSKAVSREELAAIEAARPALEGAQDVPWRRLLSLPHLWAAWVLHFSSNWVSYLMITWLPTYLSTERGFSLSSMAFGSALPFVCAMAGSNFFGVAIDRLSIDHDRTRVRKWFLLPYAASGLLVLTVPAAESPVGLVGTLCGVMFLLTAVTPVYASSALDIAPKYAGTVVGMQNSFANLAGVLGPVVVGYMVRLLGWNSAFFLTAGVTGVGVVAYLFFGKAERMAD